MSDLLPGRRYRIGRYDLLLPPEHRLDFYQAQYRLHERALGHIARIVLEKYPDAVAIDIGANVGDSAALICADSSVPVLCIEGTPHFIRYLRQNLSVLPKTIEVEECFVGARSGWINASQVDTNAGSAHFSQDTSLASPGEIPVLTLQEILERKPKFKNAHLWKIDTDGSDFDIIASSGATLAEGRPVVFFEYDPSLDKASCAAGLKAIETLLECGYRPFLVYDNFGNLLPTVHADVLGYFRELNLYLLSHRLFGRQIYYVDVCACSDLDADIASSIVSMHQAALSAAISKSGWRLE